MALWGCARSLAHGAAARGDVCVHAYFFVAAVSALLSALCCASPAFVMDAAAVAALAAAVDHVQAAALSELMRERDRLAAEAEDLRRQVAQLRGAAAWAVNDLRHGDAEMAEQRLLDALEGESDEDD